MSDGGVHADAEAIAELEQALGRFGQRSVEITAAVVRATRRIVETLDERQATLQRTISRLEDELAGADDGRDVARLESRLEDTREALDRLRRQRRELDGAVERCRSEARSVERLGTEAAPKARAHLRALGDGVIAYRALRSGAGAGPAVSSAGPSVTGNASSALARFDPTQFRLPVGFRWISVDLIDMAEVSAVSVAGAFHKTAAEVIRHGLEQLRSTILPAMNDAARPADSDEFYRRDAARGVSYEHGEQRVFDAFFGLDPIRLDRAAREGSYSVTDGRHRIACAVEAGWDAVPAQTSEGAPQ